MAVLDRTRQPLSRTTSRRFGFPAVTILAAGLVVAAALLPVAQSSNATSTGNQIRQLETRKADLQARIHLTQAEVAQIAAVERIEQRARAMGMVPADRWIYVDAGEAAPVTGMPARYLNEEEPPASVAVSRPWWKALLSKLPVP